MNPINFDEIPTDIKDYVNNIKSITFPKQGYTSNVGILFTDEGLFALKRAKGEWFSSWLKKEVSVLTTLTNETNLLIPKVEKFVEQQDQCWALIEYFEGETIRSALAKETNKEKRAEMIFNFGKVLSELHSTPCPKDLKGEEPWLEKMLQEAEYNLTYRKVDGTKHLLNKIKRDRPKEYKQTLIHGDFTIDNVLVANGEITSIIDWSGGAYGDPRYDVSIAIRPKPNVFEEQDDKRIFFEGYGGNILDESDYDYFVNGLYEFF